MSNIDSLLNHKQTTELSIKKRKGIEKELIGTIIPHQGHTLWEIDNISKSIKEARITNTSYKFGVVNNQEIITEEGYTYVSALNKKSAINKFKKGRNGSKLL
jgi:hypothetical protein